MTVFAIKAESFSDPEQVALAFRAAAAAYKVIERGAFHATLTSLYLAPDVVTSTE
jgi:hypothetical protein